jgi:hypothetical protein
VQLFNRQALTLTPLKEGLDSPAVEGFRTVDQVNVDLCASLVPHTTAGAMDRVVDPRARPAFPR